MSVIAVYKRSIFIDSQRFYKLHRTEAKNFAHQLTRVTIVVCLLFTGHIRADPAEFRAEYKADFNGIPIRATGVRTLKRVAGNQYLLVSSAKTFLAAVTEQSLFSLEADGVMKPLEYQYHRSGLGRNRDAVLSFDWARNRVLNDVQSKLWEMDIPDGAMDKLLYQLKLSSDLANAYERNQPWPELSYDIADGGKLKSYHFKVVGEDVTDTPLGRFNTIKVTRVQEDEDRTTMLWLAHEHEFLLVRLRVFEEEDDGFELLLTEAVLNGERLKRATSSEPRASSTVPR